VQEILELEKYPQWVSELVMPDMPPENMGAAWASNDQLLVKKNEIIK
jgi:hypothetical protein